MWDRFDEDSLRSIKKARNLAMAHGYRELELGHILLGMAEHVSSGKCTDKHLKKDLTSLEWIYKGAKEQPFPGSKRVDTGASEGHYDIILCQSLKNLMVRLLKIPVAQLVDEKISCSMLLTGVLIELFSVAEHSDDVEPEDETCDTWMSARLLRLCTDPDLFDALKSALRAAPEFGAAVVFTISTGSRRKIFGNSISAIENALSDIVSEGDMDEAVTEMGRARRSIAARLAKRKWRADKTDKADKADEDDTADEADEADEDGNSDKADNADKDDNADKADEANQADNADKSGKSSKSDKAGRADRASKADRASRADKADRASRADRDGKSGKAGKAGKADGSNEANDANAAVKRHKANSLPREARKIIERFGVDLVEQARKNKLDPVIARDDIIDEVIIKLLRYKKHNPLLVGAPGVGKTALVEGVAQRIADGNVPEDLRDVHIFSMNIGEVLAGTHYRGSFEERIASVLRVMREAEGRIILFIDEIHNIVGAGKGEGSMDAANMLKPALTDATIRCIGATTEEEYSKHFEGSKALDRRFLRVSVPEPTQEQAAEMIFKLRERYCAFHRVNFSDEVVRTAIRLSARYITDRFLPDKAIDLLDEAASQLRVKYSRQAENEDGAAGALVAVAAANADSNSGGQETNIVNETVEPYDSEAGEVTKCHESSESENADAPEVAPAMLELTEEDVARVVARRTGVPVSKLTASDRERLRDVEKILHERVVAQDEPIRLVSEAIWRSRAGNRNHRRPIGAFLFLGPTGVGKTELAKALAEYLFDDEKALLRIDMSEYSEKYSVSRLLGASPGYVGYDEGGQLDSLRHNPYSVVLFDEVEKAHPEIFGTLLQVIDEGSLTDSQGRRIDFKNTLIIMTSNLGFGGDEEKSFGLRANRDNADPESRYREMCKKVMESTKEFFRPEFLNRLDATVVFESLEKEHLVQIIDIMVKQINDELAVSGRSLIFTEAAKGRIVDSCNEPQYGARPLRRALRDMVETPISKEMLFGDFAENTSLIVDIDKKHDDKLAFKRKRKR